jgi:GT2 family glycosyltransferase
MFVSLVVLNHNGLNVINRCLRSLVEQNFPKKKYEILVVDNASTDTSLAVIKKNFRSVHILRSHWNRGYAGGANFGALHSRGDILAFLNNDVTLSKEWLKNMTAVLEEKKSAIVGSKVFLDESLKVLNQAGGKITLLGSGVDIGLHSSDRGPYEIVPVGYVSGAGLMMPRKLFAQLGGFDEDYFMYCEDVDMCWRAWLAGYMVLLQPTATMVHSLQSEKSASSYWPRYYNWHKNATANAFKNLGPRLLIRGLFLHVVLRMVRTFAAIRHARPLGLVTLLRADFWILRHLRSIMVKRARIQASRRVTDTQLVEKGLFSSTRAMLTLGRAKLTGSS